MSKNAKIKTERGMNKREDMYLFLFVSQAEEKRHACSNVTIHAKMMASFGEIICMSEKIGIFKENQEVPKIYVTKPNE